jgi:cytochrome c-type biogenesis protein CcmE
VLLAVLVVGGIVVTKFLTSAIDYYCNVDEIGVKSGCEAGRRLRVQGTVDAGSIRQAGGATDFTISFNGKTLPVHYQGQPGGLFQECIPVVIHGRLDSETFGPASVFDGDQVEVKHDSKYEAEHSDRIDEAKESACSPPA